MIYLDNSATTYPKPDSVYKVYENAIKYYHSNPGRGGYENSLKTAQKIFDVREKAARFFGCEQAENVIFTYNCTTAVNMVLKGILEPGDHVLISDLEHNSVLRPLNKLMRENRIKYDLFCTDFYNSQRTLEDLESKILPETKLVFCTHASNVLGVVLPVEQIGKICKKRGILFALDAAQSAGILPIDMRRYSLNFLCLAGHKGLYGPMGIGMLISDGTPLNTLLEGGTGSLSADAKQPLFLPDRLESGTANVSGIVALGAGIDFVERVKQRTILNKERRLLLHFYEEMKAAEHIHFYCDYEKLGEFCAAMSFNVVGKSSEQTAQLLADNGIAVRGGFHCAPSAHRKIGTLEEGTVRISPSFFTSESEINYTIRTMKKMG